MLKKLNKKFGIVCLSLLALPSCAPWNLKRAKTIAPFQQIPALKKAYLYINDIECEDCFKLIQGILLPVKGVRDVSLDQENGNYQKFGIFSNKVIVSYDPTIKLNRNQIRMVLEEWNFELDKIEL